MPASALRLKCARVLEARRADAGGEAERRVVGDRQRRVVVRARARTAATGPKISSRAMRMSLRDVGEERRRDVEARRVARRARSPPNARRRALLAADVDVRQVLVELALVDGRADVRAGRRAHRRPPASSCARPARATKRSWMPSVTMSRDDAVQRWPVEKNAPLTAHSTATARSASSSTTSGFLPPISSWNFFMPADAGRGDLLAGRTPIR